MIVAAGSATAPQPAAAASQVSPKVLAAKLQSVAASWNARLPERVDKLTIAKSVTSDGTTLVLTFVYDEEWASAYGEKLKPLVMKQVCLTPNNQDLFQQGGTLRLVAEKPDGKPLYHFLADKASCTPFHTTPSGKANH